MLGLFVTAEAFAEEEKCRWFTEPLMRAIQDQEIVPGKRVGLGLEPDTILSQPDSDVVPGAG